MRRHSLLKKLTLASSVSCVLVFFSCTTMADYNYSRIDSNLEQGKYGEVLSELGSEKKSIYSSHDRVLYALDIGVLEHFEGQYSDSNSLLSEAEKLIEQYSAVSISQAIASAVTNDTVKDYAGEDFENIYTNIFMALNYAALGENDDAMVEVRRFDNKLKSLKSKYEKDVEQSDSASDVKVRRVSVKFSDSALARYLSMLLYRTNGDKDNAGIDLRYLKAAFESQSSLYDFPVPSSVDTELIVPASQARLNVLAFSGRAPIKKEEVIRVPWTSGHWYKLALPVMEKQKSRINRISVRAVNTLSGTEYSQELEKIESIENIAVDTFQQRYSLILAKSLARSIARQAVSAGLDAASGDDDMLDFLITLFDIAHQVATEFIERADVRSSRYFPATASVAGLTLEPGIYSVTVDFCHGHSVKYSQTQKVKVAAGKLNLVETACLR